MKISHRPRRSHTRAPDVHTPRTVPNSIAAKQGTQVIPRCAKLDQTLAKALRCIRANYSAFQCIPVHLPKVDIQEQIQASEGFSRIESERANAATFGPTYQALRSVIARRQRVIEFRRSGPVTHPIPSRRIAAPRITGPVPSLNTVTGDTRIPVSRGGIYLRENAGTRRSPRS